jgi:hypothetical protein
MSCSVCLEDYYVPGATFAEGSDPCSYVNDKGDQCKSKAGKETDICKMHTKKRTPITCLGCYSSCCRICYRTQFLESSIEPSCMHCEKRFDLEFLLGKDEKAVRFSKAFIWGAYRTHREDVLLDKLMARMPHFQLIATSEISIQRCTNLIKDAEISTGQINQEKYDLSITPGISIPELRARKRPLNLELLDLIDIREESEYTLKNEKFFIDNGHYPGSKDISKEKDVNFVNRGQCPRNDCNGFIADKWKCGICDAKVCMKCSKEKEEIHECKDEDIASTKLIREETKGCPGCRVRVFKIHGCFAKDTPILMYDGTVKNVQDVNINDTLIGDDGNKRKVQETFSGKDKMYEIIQKNGDNYTVNSKHTLVLKYTGDKNIHWIEKGNYWKLRWFCRENYVERSKIFKVKNQSKNQAKLLAEEYRDKLDIEDTIHIIVDNYLKLKDSVKNKLFGFKSSNGINYPNQDINLDPYLLGIWLGDGTHTHPVIASNFMNKLRQYNLVGNKHIPKQYMINSRDIRLKLLAGIIDSDGSVANNGKRVIIVQTRIELYEQIILLSRSLGFTTNVSIHKRKNESIFGGPKKDYKDQCRINISGNISEIPTLLPRKKCENSTPNKDHQRTQIEVKYIEEGEYFGFKLDKNKLFIGTDFTCLKNCYQMFCTNCHVFFDWKSGKILKKTAFVHNPHYFEYMRENGGTDDEVGQVDVCGFSARTILNLVIPKVGKDILNGHLSLANQILDEVNRWTDPIDKKIQSTSIDYLKGNIDRDDLKKLVQRHYKASTKAEFANERRNMYGNNVKNILAVYCDKIKNSKTNTDSIVNEASEKILAFRKYTDDSLYSIGVIFNSQSPRLSNIEYRQVRERTVNMPNRIIEYIAAIRANTLTHMHGNYIQNNILRHMTVRMTAHNDYRNWIRNNPDWNPTVKEIIPYCN